MQETRPYGTHGPDRGKPGGPHFCNLGSTLARYQDGGACMGASLMRFLCSPVA